MGRPASSELTAGRREKEGQASGHATSDEKKTWQDDEAVCGIVERRGSRDTWDGAMNEWATTPQYQYK